MLLSHLQRVLSPSFQHRNVVCSFPMFSSLFIFFLVASTSSLRTTLVLHVVHLCAGRNKETLLFRSLDIQAFIWKYGFGEWDIMAESLF